MRSRERKNHQSKDSIFESSDLLEFLKSWKTFMLFICVLSLVAGCSRQILPGFSTTKINSPDSILKNIKEREKGLTSLKGIAKIKVTDDKANYSLKEVIVVERPSSLRMETLSFFGHPLFFLTAKNNTLSVLSTKENRYYRGEVNNKNLSILFPFSLKSKDLFSILLGEAPLIPYSDTDVRLSEKKNLYLLRLEQEETKSTQLLWVDPLEFLVQRSEIYDSQRNLVFAVEFDNYKKVNTQLFPMSTIVFLPLTSTKIRIDYSELEVNATLRHDSFHLDVPPGVEVVDLD